MLRIHSLRTLDLVTIGTHAFYQIARIPLYRLLQSSFIGYWNAVFIGQVCSKLLSLIVTNKPMPGWVCLFMHVMSLL